MEPQQSGSPLHGELDSLVADAHALTMFRVLPNGEGRAYTATWFPKDPWAGCEQFIRQCRACGWLTSASDDSYAVLDVLNEDCDIVQDFGVTSPGAFRQIKRRLRLAVEEAPDA